ncbi:hypothetical protein TNIN_148881 [Trichonephila inaurata madagascariensis]|uniref:Uncharacterized protein n=1 Tax=Trichonephila inaurata madagascariensis TaxID=2747483 RepID=A0A8X6X5P1_9ARAC|nr:hypothetical protein TNIN_148881 [Trichonephila inaurata madagascariensis]
MKNYCHQQYTKKYLSNAKKQRKAGKNNEDLTSHAPYSHTTQNTRAHLKLITEISSYRGPPSPHGRIILFHAAEDVLDDIYKLIQDQLA